MEHLKQCSDCKEDKAYSQYALSWLKPGTALQMAGYTTGLDDRRRKCGDVILKVNGLSKYYAQVKALDNISMEIRRGETMRSAEKTAREIDIYQIADRCDPTLFRGLSSLKIRFMTD